MSEIYYSEYNLNRNPFSTERHDYPLVGREGIMRDLQYHISRMANGGGFHFIIIKTGYGLGKTRTLYELVFRLRQLESDFLGGRKIIIPERPIRTLPPRPPGPLLSKYLLPEIFRRVGRETLRELKRELEILSARLSEDCSLILERYNVDRHLASAFLKLNTEYDYSAWKWFLSDALSATERRNLGDVLRIATEDAAERVLVDFLKILAVLDYKALILPIDEFEYVAMQPKSKQISIVETFRSLYDRVTDELTLIRKVAALVLVFATTPEGWNKVEGLAEAYAFRERVRRDNVFIELSELSEDQVEEFIVKRLQQDRLAGVSVPRPLFPFEDDYPHRIDEHAVGKPRVVSSYSCIVLDEGLRFHKPTITGDFAEGVLRDLHFIIEPIPSEREGR